MEKDKSKIAELICELDQKKNEALEGAYERVNKVFIMYLHDLCSRIMLGVNKVLLA